MITLNVIWFLAMLAASLVAGAAVAIHVYGVNADQDHRVTRFRRDVAINDAADMAETGDPR